MTSPMRFKNLTWNYNPHSIKITSKKSMFQGKIPDGDNILKSYGRDCIVIIGEGCFYGENAFDKYRELWKLFKENKAGILSVPEFVVVKAYFSSLEIIGEATDNLINYKFTFIEDINSDREKYKVTRHIAKDGESLWDVSYNYDISVEELLSLNPTLKHPFDLLPEFEVKLC